MKKRMNVRTMSVVVSLATIFQTVGVSTNLIDVNALASEVPTGGISGPSDDPSDPVIEVTTPNAVEIKLENDPNNAYILQTYLKRNEQYIYQVSDDITYKWYCDGEELNGELEPNSKSEPHYYLGYVLDSDIGKTYEVKVFGNGGSELLASAEYTVNENSDFGNPRLSATDHLTQYEHDGKVTLKWDKATDSKTPQSKLKYYLYQKEKKHYDTIDEWETNGKLIFSGTINDSQEKGQVDVEGLNDNITYYFQLIVEDEDGNKTKYITESRDSLISEVTIIRDGDTLKPVLYDRYDKVIEAPAHYEWSIDGNVVSTENKLKIDSSYNFKDIDLKVQCDGYENPFTDEYAVTVNSVRIGRENNTLVCKIFDQNKNIIINGFQVNCKWIKDGQVVGTNRTYDLSSEDYGKEIKLETTVDGIDYTFFESGTFKDTKNAAVKLFGDTRVNNTLVAKVVDKSNNDLSAELEPSYEWIRMDEQNADSVDVALKEGKATWLGEGTKYTLTNGDAGKYIRVIAWYTDADGTDRELLPAYTSSVILKKSLSESSSSSSGSSSSSSSSSSSESNKDTSANNSSNSNNNQVKSQTRTFENTKNGKVKLVNGEGQALAGWNQVNGQWYLTNLDGIVLTGWQQTGDGKWYYLNPTGEMATGWQKLNDSWYFLNNSGAMATGWQNVGGKWYLLNSDGAMQTGWQKVNGNWYFLYSDGSMASNTSIGGYKLDENGAWY